jgi:hypothetical protein
VTLLSFYDTMADTADTQVSNLNQSNAAISSKPTRRLLSEVEWEKFKPYIRRMYIERNLPFNKMCILLQEKFRFTPTVSFLSLVPAFQDIYADLNNV